MSKQATEEGGGLKSDLVEKERRIIKLEAELEETKAANKRLSTQNSHLRSKGAGTETKEKESKETSADDARKLSDLTSEKHAHEEPKPPQEPTGGLPPAPGVAGTKNDTSVHLVKSWSPRFCPDCGTKNPEFKDEVQCHSCKVGLGAKEKVTSAEFKVCPNCGKGKDNGGGWEYVPGAKVV